MGIIGDYTQILTSQFLFVANGSLAEDIIPYVTEFQYVEEEKKIPYFRLTVANPALRFRNDPRFAEGASFKVRFGYTANMSDTLTFVLTRAAPKYPKDGVPTIQVVAFGPEKVIHVGSNAVNYGPVSSTDVARQIAERNGLSFVGTESGDARPQSRVQSASVTDLQYLYLLADALNYETWVEDGTLYFQEQNYRKTAKLEFTYATDPLGTLLSFDPEVDLNKAPNVKTAGVDPKKADPHASKPTGDREFGSVIPTGKRAVLADFNAVTSQWIDVKATDPKDGITHDSKETHGPVIDAHGFAKAKKIDMSAIKASAEFIGDPRLRIREMIRITGVDDIYSGNWKITSTTHSIKPGQVYLTSAKLARDAGKGKGKDQNKHDEKTDGDDGKGPNKNVAKADFNNLTVRIFGPQQIVGQVVQ